MLDPKLHNPYRGQHGQWLRGSFHCHCQEGSCCGSIPLAEVVRLYHDIGADFLAVTDHNFVTDLQALRTAYPDMVFLEGVEHTRGLDLLFASPSMPPLHELPLSEALAQAGADVLTIVSHPRPQKDREYWSRQKLLALGTRPDGIEIYNGHYSVEAMRARGCLPQYTGFWDDILTAGDRLWGFANDDFHDLADFNHAFNMVLVEEPTAHALVRAAKCGRFYASTGLILTELVEDRGQVAVTIETAGAGRFIGPHGRVLAQAEGRHFEYTLTDEAYIRFEAEGQDGALFLQPMFR